MTTIRRLFILAAASASTVLAAIATGPAAFAQVPPDPAGTGPVSHGSVMASSGGMLGWQIALIAVGAALVAALLTTGVHRFAFYRRLAHQTA